MAAQNTSKEERFKNLRKSGLSIAEANRWVYGWSDPAMKTLWQDVMKSRPKGSPQFTQKEAFKIVLKTVFGRDYSADQELILSHESYKEVIDGSAGLKRDSFHRFTGHSWIVNTVL